MDGFFAAGNVTEVAHKLHTSRICIAWSWSSEKSTGKEMGTKKRHALFSSRKEEQTRVLPFLRENGLGVNKPKQPGSIHSAILLIVMVVKDGGGSFGSACCRVPGISRNTYVEVLAFICFIYYIVVGILP